MRNTLPHLFVSTHVKKQTKNNTNNNYENKYIVTHHHHLINGLMVDVLTVNFHYFTMSFIHTHLKKETENESK